MTEHLNLNYHARRSQPWSLPPHAVRERKHKARPMSLQGLRGSRQLSILDLEPIQPRLDLLRVCGTPGPHARQHTLDSGAVTGRGPSRPISPAPRARASPGTTAPLALMPRSAYPVFSPISGPRQRCGPEEPDHPLGKKWHTHSPRGRTALTHSVRTPSPGRGRAPPAAPPARSAPPSRPGPALGPASHRTPAVPSGRQQGGLSASQKAAERHPQTPLATSSAVRRGKFPGGWSDQLEEL